MVEVETEVRTMLAGVRIGGVEGHRDDFAAVRQVYCCSMAVKLVLGVLDH